MRLIPLLLLIQCSSTFDILLYAVAIGKSHIDFTSSLINRLTERGHNVVSRL